jgi:hypothetical protein
MRQDIGAFVNGDQGRMVIGLSDAVPPARSQSLLLDYGLRYPGVDLATVTSDAADFPGWTSPQSLATRPTSRDS